MNLRHAVTIAALLAVAASAAPASAQMHMPGMQSPAHARYATELRGTVRSMDPALGLVLIHHGAEAGMGAMTMAVKLNDRRQMKGLRPGMTVRLRCDERADPYVCVRV
jgi:Cu/Ag efflux protein CusF